MLQDKNGKITMSAWELNEYRALTETGETPKTWGEFVAGLERAKEVHRQKIACQVPHAEFSKLMIELIDDHLANPHESGFRDYQRKWESAGRPVGKDEHAKAGLFNPARRSY